MRFVPEWFPGAEFKKKARLWSATLSDIVELPHKYVKQQLVNIYIELGIKWHVLNGMLDKAAGTAFASVSSTLLDGKQLTADEEHDIKWTTMSMYSGEPILEPSRSLEIKSDRYNQVVQIPYVFRPLAKRQTWLFECCP